jgi:predicted branched-subunit amino acid permease
LTVQVVTTIDRDAHAPAGRWQSARWVVPLFALSGIVLVPWVVFLVSSLPSTHAAAHWDIAWAGFDVALALLLLGVAVSAWRRSPWLEGVATAAAALLVVDAWFDILTSSSRVELVIAIGEAVLVELPLAVVCVLLARNAEQVLRRGTPM